MFLHQPCALPSPRCSSGACAAACPCSRAPDAEGGAARPPTAAPPPACAAAALRKRGDPVRPAGSVGRHGRGGEDQAVQEPAAHEGQAGAAAGPRGRRREGGEGRERPCPRWSEERAAGPGGAAAGELPAAGPEPRGGPGAGGWSRAGPGLWWPSGAVGRGSPGQTISCLVGFIVSVFLFIHTPGLVWSISHVYTWPGSVCPALTHECLLPHVLQYVSIYLQLRLAFHSGLQLSGLFPSNFSSKKRSQSCHPVWSWLNTGRRSQGVINCGVLEGLIQESSFMIAAKVSPKKEPALGTILESLRSTWFLCS